MNSSPRLPPREPRPSASLSASLSVHGGGRALPGLPAPASAGRPERRPGRFGVGPPRRPVRHVSAAPLDPVAGARSVARARRGGDVALPAAAGRQVASGLPDAGARAAAEGEGSTGRGPASGGAEHAQAALTVASARRRLSALSRRRRRGGEGGGGEGAAGAGMASWQACMVSSVNNHVTLNVLLHIVASCFPNRRFLCLQLPTIYRRWLRSSIG